MSYVKYKYNFLPELVKLWAESILDHLENTENITYLKCETDEFDMQYIDTEIGYRTHKCNMFVMYQGDDQLGTCKTCTLYTNELNAYCIQEVSDNVILAGAPLKDCYMLTVAVSAMYPLSKKYWDNFQPLESLPDWIHQCYTYEQWHKFCLETKEGFCYEEFNKSTDVP